jgi:ADP-ribose pyrophosphatase
LDPSETPERCARRELEEETGMTAGVVQPLTTIWTTPGFTDERIHLFLGSELEKGTHRREHDEFMELHEIPWSRVMAMVETGEIRDGKSLVALLYAHCFRR